MKILLELINDRFKELGFNTIISTNIFSHISINIYNYNIATIYFIRRIMVYCNKRNGYTTFEKKYDELTDIDEFIGEILTTALYE